MLVIFISAIHMLIIPMLVIQMLAIFIEEKMYF